MPLVMKLLHVVLLLMLLLWLTLLMRVLPMLLRCNANFCSVVLAVVDGRP